MRVFHVTPTSSSNSTRCRRAAGHGFLWIGSARREFEVRAARLQAALQRWTGGQLVDLHVSDLLNNQLPATSTTPRGTTCWSSAAWPPAPAAKACSSTTPRHAGLGAQGAGVHRHQPGGLRGVRPRAAHRAPHRLRGARVLRPAPAAAWPADRGAAGAPAGQPGRPDAAHGQPHGRQLPGPAPPADAPAGHAAAELLDPKSRFDDWQVLLDSRNALHLLEDTCEDQRSAVQEWIDALDEWPPEPTPWRSANASCCACARATCWSTSNACWPCAPAGAVGRDRGADALLGAGPPHQRHHAHADRADRGLPAAEPDHRLLRHELRFRCR
jgi:magnesium transporter